MSTTTLAPPTKKRDVRGGFLTALAWVMALMIFAPIAWMLLTSFHYETDAATSPPNLFAPLTTIHWELALSGRITPYLVNSLMAAGLSTVFVLLFAIPAAYATAVKPIENVRGFLTWVLSTKFLPLIAALVPLYLLFKQLGLLDNIWALVIFYTALNLPIAIWMCHSFLAEIPKDIMAAAEVDGASLPTILLKIVFPIAMPGIAATALICFILAWNEFLFALNLTSSSAKTAPWYMVTFITSEGLFFAQLSAGALAVSIPVVLAGWIAQDKLVQGLSMGAVK